jgi:ATP-dependent Zn protease
MDDGFLSIMVSWFPFLLLVGLWFYFMWRTGALKRGAMTNSEYLEEHLKETRRSNAALEAVIARMDDRILKLENADRARPPS